MVYESVVYARAGLIGNPSDGYFGKTISFSVRNFSARAILQEDSKVSIIPNYSDRYEYEDCKRRVTSQLWSKCR